MKQKKFSIIIPVYNVEQYLKECLESVYNQTYNNFEVIIINDGSTDNSSKILENYINKQNTKIINQTNMGLSIARNNGIKYVKGDYIIFLDSDDYLELNTLEILEKTIKDEDLIRYQLIETSENNNKKIKIEETKFNNLNGIEAFDEIVKYKYIDNACLYCYKKDYFLKNNFKFKENYFHEDFGLIPITIIKAKKVSSINKCLYNYRCRSNSIMNTYDINKIKKKCEDMYELGLENIKTIKSLKESKTYLSYIANCMIIKGRELPKKYRKEYYKKLISNDIFNYMLKDTLSRKIKYIMSKFSYNIYLKVMK